MNDLSQPEQYYSRGVAHSDIRDATKTNPAQITRYEFVTRQFNAYLDEDGRYREELVAEYPRLSNRCTA